MTPYSFGVKMATGPWAPPLSTPQLPLPKPAPAPATANIAANTKAIASNSAPNSVPNYGLHQMAVRMTSPMAGAAMDAGLAANNVYQSTRSKLLSEQQQKFDQFNAQNKDPNTAMASPYVTRGDVLQHITGLNK
jgi:hypothetical protein